MESEGGSVSLLFSDPPDLACVGRTADDHLHPARFALVLECAKGCALCKLGSGLRFRIGAFLQFAAIAQHLVAGDRQRKRRFVLRVFGRVESVCSRRERQTGSGISRFLERNRSMRSLACLFSPPPFHRAVIGALLNAIHSKSRRFEILRAACGIRQCREWRIGRHGRMRTAFVCTEAELRVNVHAIRHEVCFRFGLRQIRILGLCRHIHQWRARIRICIDMRSEAGYAFYQTAFENILRFRRMDGIRLRHVVQLIDMTFKLAVEALIGLDQRDRLGIGRFVGHERHHHIRAIHIAAADQIEGGRGEVSRPSMNHRPAGRFGVRRF